MIKFILYIFVPFIFIGLFVIFKPKSRINLAINTITALLIFFTLYFSYSWYTTSIYLRYLFLVLFLVAIVINIFRFKKLQIITKRSVFLRIVFILKIFIFLFFCYEIYWVYIGLNAPKNTISLDFPLKNGKYAITSGGNSNMVNAHFNNEPFCYAVDIIKLNSLGRMWDNTFFESNKLEDYLSYNDTVYAPCNGKVIEISDNKIDQPIGVKGDTSNYIRIEYINKYVVMLAHLKKNSFLVEEDENVVSGQPIALIGNSGKSSAPHLHIHLVHISLDIYMPFKLNGRFPIINDIYKNQL